MNVTQRQILLQVWEKDKDWDKAKISTIARGSGLTEERVQMWYNMQKRAVQTDQEFATKMWEVG
jgi:hypothetical protein